jgi:16S rRNA (cytosine967-C5)-methyltransferase
LSNFNISALSARVLVKVLQGVALETALARYRDTAAYPQVAHVCFEAMRHYFSLSERLQSVVNRPTSRLDLEVWCVLLAAASQIEHSRTPVHAVVSTAVEATRKVGKSSASGLVNAALRRYRPDDPPNSLEAVSELPAWLVGCINRCYSESKTSLIEALNSRAPLTLRVNSSRISLSEYCGFLDDAGIGYRIPGVENAVTFEQPRPMTTIPGYREGYFVVQDLTSQLAVPLLMPQSGDRILDACAAPGVKTAQIHDLFRNCTVDSIDVKDECSTWNIVPNSQLNRGIEIRKGDLRKTNWWDRSPYQRILLDVPCSGTGTIRRHPDIKATRTPDQISKLASLQLQLLGTTWKTLGPGGRLVYCTCSILPKENDGVIERFVEENPDARVEPIELSDGCPTSCGRQILPTVNGGDGFYFSCLHKCEA